MYIVAVCCKYVSLSKQELELILLSSISKTAIKQIKFWI